MNKNYINKLESKLNVKLPNNYIDFLLGKDFKISDVLEDVCYESNKSSDIILDFVAMHFFYYEDKDEVGDLYNNNTTSTIGFYSRIPKDFIAIGCDLVGDQICLGVKGEYVGKVYMWEMEFEADENTHQPYYDNMTLITNTFEEFLGGLFIDE